MTHAKDTYGENDSIWYTEQGGRRPHAAAAYLVLSLGVPVVAAACGFLV